MSLLVRDPFRDYVYVSARKAGRMSQTLKRRGWTQVQGVEIKAGPVGANVNLGADTQAEDAIGQVPQVERAIERNLGVHDLSDQQLQAGHWFRVAGIPMIYGIPDIGLGGVLFLGPAGSATRNDPTGTASRRFVLGGSSEYLLDRGSMEGASMAGSLPKNVYAMLRALVGEDQDGERTPKEAESSFSRINFDRLARLLSSGGEPMTALARCLDIATDTDPPTVIGTPLYVTFQTPR